MTTASEIQGTPCITERVHRREGDPRRHQSHCYYYCKSRDFCTKRLILCPGSQHCDFYVDENNLEAVEEIKEKEAQLVREKNYFSGIREVFLDNIKVNENFRRLKINETEIQRVVNYYNEHKTLDRPLLISCYNDCYQLEGNYIEYLAAKKCKMRKVHAQIGTLVSLARYERLRTEKLEVFEKKLGRGIVLWSSIEKVLIKFDSGYRVEYNIVACIDEGLLKFK